MSELQYWLWLTLKKGLKNQKITALLEYFGKPEAVYIADKETLSQVSGLTRAELSSLCDKSMDKVSKVIAVCKKKGIKILTFDSPYYPQLLTKIYDPPYVLYARYRERIDLNEHMTISVVGTRKCSPYGAKMSGIIARDLAKEGVTVVSGMAEGIDGAANKGALTGGGVTVAVLGCGVDMCYPAMHKQLMEDIINHGMVLSEYPPGTPAYPGNFKIRNRIITGLSYGTVIVEAPVRSGAVNSANWTIEQNRELFVVPGDATRGTAKGSNKMLVDGAKPVLSAEDVLFEYKERFAEYLEHNRPAECDWPEDIDTEDIETDKINEEQEAVLEEKEEPKRPQVSLDGLNENERAVVMLLTEEPRHIDQLAELGISVGVLSATLTMLELKGYIKALPGKFYCLK